MANSVNLDTSRRLDITCRKGDDFRLVLTVKDTSGNPLDMTGGQTGLNDYTFKMEVRDSDTASTTVVPSGNVSYVQAVSGTLEVKIADTNMTMAGGLYVYDLQATDPNGAVSTWLQGLFKVNEDVTV